MSADWKQGDLAVCVDDGWMYPWPENPRKGDVLRVAEVRKGRAHNQPTSFIYLAFEGKPHKLGWINLFFRKVDPDAEPCEDEFKQMIKKMKPIKALPVKVNDKLYVEPRGRYRR